MFVCVSCVSLHVCVGRLELRNRAVEETTPEEQAGLELRGRMELVNAFPLCLGAREAIGTGLRVGGDPGC